MNASLLSWLRCPFCGGNFHGSETHHIAGDPGYGVLTCYCGRYPVVAGIPVLKKGVVGTDGQTADEVIALIETGHHYEALLAMAMTSRWRGAELAPGWTELLPPIRGIWRLKALFGQAELHRWRRHETAFLRHPENGITAYDLLAFYLRHSRGVKREPFGYYVFRFGQPRHLVALSFATLVHQSRKPTLDLACGFGHVTRSLFHRGKNQQVIGIDHNFWMLYVAKNWIAPEAEYVCAEGDLSLPFEDGAFSVVFCSDAFAGFVNKVACIQELKRLTRDDGLIMLVGVRNSLLRKHLYTPLALPPEGYQALVVDMPHRLVANSHVLARYLQKQGPALARSDEMGDLAHEAWLSVLASPRQEFFHDYPKFEDWPHAKGCLGLNPLYVEERRERLGDVHLRRLFPTPYYEEENAECKQYLPEAECLSANVLVDLRHGRRTQEIERLIKQCVVLGMPERYRTFCIHQMTCLAFLFPALADQACAATLCL